ncbi:MAG TPA: hypothetical protein VN696_07560 [Pyrinomonadaceae bacterium]|nr:hypothetical protein [Pyrinomonadaceae bacterium]
MTRSVAALVIAFLALSAAAVAQSPYTISGELRDDAGRLFAGGNVCALLKIPSGLNVRDKTCAVSDSQGKFTINIAQPGTYQVIADKMSEHYMPTYLPFYRVSRRPVTEVILGQGTENQTATVTMPPKSGLITGKVIDEATDRRVPNFVVWVWQARDPNARTHLVVNGQSGMFQLPVPPTEPIGIRVVADGYEDWVIAGGMLVSMAGARKGPGALVVPAGQKADFAVYLKRKTPPPDDTSDSSRLPAPIQLSPADSQVFDIFPRHTRLEWNPVPGAISYAVEIESCWPRGSEEKRRLPDDGECINPSSYEEKYGLHETNYEFIFKGAQPGRWRVWAIDSNHKPGMRSPWRSFTYLK